MNVGALSIFHQLTHEFNLPKHERIIRRVMMLANGPGMQPRSISEAQEQFDQLLIALSIPTTLSSAQKLSRLRAISALDLVNASLDIQRHEFRHVTDGRFILPGTFASIETGSWVEDFIDQGIELLVCECEFEHFAFATWHNPEENTLQAVRRRLCVDYQEGVINSLVDNIYVPDGKTLPAFAINQQICHSWFEFFGVLYAEIQVHALQRGFVNLLSEKGAGNRVKRARVGWRAKRADKNFPKEMKATHGTDTALWFFGDGVGLELLKKEEAIVREWCEGWWSWITGQGWGRGWDMGDTPTVLRYIDSNGKIEMIADAPDDWERGLKVWNLVRALQGPTKES